MRGAATTMTVLRPRSVREALTRYAEAPAALPLAGGTDVMVAWNLGALNDRVVLDLSRLSDWTRIARIDATGAAGVRGTSRGQVLRLGALATHTAVQRHAGVRRHFGLLAAACATVGGLQIQNRGTLGGNVANASPAGDTFPALAVYRAQVQTASAAGRRTVPFSDIFAGVKKTTLRPGELIASIDLPLPARPPDRQLFRKVGTRSAQAISKTVFAGLVWLDPDGTIRDVRLALGSMAPTVRRLSHVEAALTGHRLTADAVRGAAALVAADVSPIDDVRSTATYRLKVSEALVESFLLDPIATT